ncbi:MAG: SDR family oxidoreductase [Acidimicrobiia bacterium]|nr:SDR family oxidoreductase [Acidimicrobiia bacterium]
MELAGRVALVTGGGRGIGRGIALGLAEDGADVVVNYRRDDAAAAETVAAIEALGRRAVAISASIADYDECRRLVAESVEAMGQLDIVVLNAGIASRGQSVADSEPAEFERVVHTHAFGAWYLCHEAVPHLRRRARGDIVMISSAATHSYGANGAPYNMGKAALEALAYTLAKEEVANNIHVNVAAPGLVDTEMGKRLARAVTGVEDIHELDAGMPFGRVCTPEDVADVVRFFCSKRAGYITGERLYVHGGGQDWRAKR